MCIIPVSVKHKKNGRQITDAMLDNCSQGSFAHEAILKQLGVKGTKTTLSLNTLRGERSENSSAIAGMQVKRIIGDDNWLRLPRLYARKDLPVDKEEIATPEKIIEWEYLKLITKEIVQNDDVCIELSIGANCIEDLESMQVTASESGGPYAYGTRLGWCIIGPIMNGDNKDSISCHQVTVRDASESQVASHHFGIKDSIKDITLEEMFKMMYKNDFSEPAGSGLMISMLKKQFVTLYWSNYTGANNVKMDGSVLEEKSCFKMLGLSFSSKLDWGSYIICIAKTVSKEFGALICSVKFLASDVALYLYKSTIRPCIE